MRSCLIILLTTCLSGIYVDAGAQDRHTSSVDTMRALVVFTRFADDNVEGDARINYRDWPLELTRAPAFAGHLLSPTPRQPFPDSSLTEYFHKQSNGRFVFFGTVWPDIYVSSQPEEDYHRPHGGYGRLTLEILHHLSDSGIDFRDYDYNGDGELDQLFVILRRDSIRDQKMITWTGISCLDARCGGGLAGGPSLPEPTFDGITVDWNSSGSILFNRTPGNVSPFWYHLRLMAHEFGHDLFSSHFVHIPADRSNDVPAMSNRDPQTSCVGYALMVGSGGAPDCRGDETISAFERSLLGWIECQTPDESTRRSFVLRDLYAYSDCFRFTNSKGATLWVSNRQRIGPFDQLRLAGVNRQHEIGLLRTTGLLVMRSTANNRLDILPADNSLDLSTKNRAYDGDLYGGAGARQITPFTRPNINGYSSYPAQFQPDWSAVDNIYYDAVDSTAIRFDFVRDFRDSPTFRTDSWIGPYPDTVAFDGMYTVAHGATVIIDNTTIVGGGVKIATGGSLVVMPGATLVIGDCQPLDVSSYATVVLDGQLIFGGILKSRPESDVHISSRSLRSVRDCLSN